MRGRKLDDEEVRVVFSLGESRMIREWLQESFNLLEIGGRHRIIAARLLEMLEIIEKD